MLGGTGEVVFGGTGGGNFLFGTSGTLTIGSGITLHGTQSGQLGQGGVGLVLQGTVLADRTNQTITVRGTSVSNTGTLRAVNGGRLDVNPLANGGLVQADTGGTVSLTGATSFSAGAQFPTLL